MNAHTCLEQTGSKCYVLQYLDHDAQRFKAYGLGAKRSKGVVHLCLTLVDPALALHEARELLQAVLRRNGPVGGEGKGVG